MNTIETAQQHGILNCIGNTPLVSLRRIFSNSKIQLFGKMEMFNPGGSIKDRTAFNILKNAMAAGRINNDTTVIESTSGNMGIGLARVCHYYGLRLLLVTDPHINAITTKILKTYNAQIITVHEHDEQGGYLKTRLQMVSKLLTQIPNSYWPDQYHNMDNPIAHEQTFLEIAKSLTRAPDYIFVATSTCGTIRGLGDAIQKHQAHTKIIAVDAVGSIIFGDEPKKRIIPGMGASRPSDFVKMELIEDVVLVSDEQSVEGCYQLLQTESILAGGSSGAIIKAIEKKLPQLPEGSTVVGIFADDGERYLSTIYSEDWVKQHFSTVIH